MRITATLLLAASTLVCPLHAQAPGDVLFDTDQVITMDLTFPMADYWSQLVANKSAGNDVSLPATLTITDLSGTYTFDSVAVRLKGNSSYDFYPTLKKPMKLDFDHFVDGQDYHGLKKLNLNNGWSDPTFLREKVFLDVCWREGVLAPRMSYANVSLNGQALGPVWSGGTGGQDVLAALAGGQRWQPVQSR